MWPVNEMAAVIGLLPYAPRGTGGPTSIADHVDQFSALPTKLLEGPDRELSPTKAEEFSIHKLSPNISMYLSLVRSKMRLKSGLSYAKEKTKIDFGCGSTWIKVSEEQCSFERGMRSWLQE